jgi:hypothetical protein
MDEAKYHGAFSKVAESSEFVCERTSVFVALRPYPRWIEPAGWRSFFAVPMSRRTIGVGQYRFLVVRWTQDEDLVSPKNLAHSMPAAQPHGGHSVWIWARFQDAGRERARCPLWLGAHLRDLIAAVHIAQARKRGRKIPRRQ